MQRRQFLSLLASASASLALDPEMLLWQLGQRTHILPPPTGWRSTASGLITPMWVVQETVAAWKNSRSIGSVKTWGDLGIIRTRPNRRA